MKNLTIMLLVIALIVLVGGTLLLLQLGIFKTTTENNTQPTNTPDIIIEQPNQEDPQPSPKTVNVNIQNYAFNPSTLTVNRGDTVTWTNQDTVEHNVSNSTFESELLGQGESYSYTFNSTGTFDYICTPHPYMEGSVVVIE